MREPYNGIESQGARGAMTAAEGCANLFNGIESLVWLVGLLTWLSLHVRSLCLS